MNKVLLAMILLMVLGSIKISAMQKRSISPISGKTIIMRPNSPTVVVPNGNTPRLQLIAKMMKDEEEVKQAFIAKTIELNKLVTEKDAEIAKLKEKIAEQNKLITDLEDCLDYYYWYGYEDLEDQGNIENFGELKD